MTGYRSLRLGEHDATVWEPVAEAVGAAIEESGTLAGWAEAHAERIWDRGRGPAWGVRLGPEAAVVRHFRRGGWMTSLLGDRYLGRPGRPLAELAASERLRRAGVPTPKVLAVVTAPARPGYRSDLATRWIEPGLDLATLLAPGMYPPAERRAAIRAAGETIGKAHRAGLEHADLNPGNVFVQPAGDGTWTAFLLDLDRARFQSGSGPRFKKKNVARFERWLEKARRTGGVTWEAADRAAFQEGYLEGMHDA